MFLSKSTGKTTTTAATSRVGFWSWAALTSSPGRHRPPTLDEVCAGVPRYQQPDGHFGVAVDLKKPLVQASLQIPMLPIPMLWGNARLLVGLVAAGERFQDAALLAAARRLGDFYVATGDDLCSPARLAEYQASGTEGAGYTCCYFPAIESLALLYRATHDDRYLQQAQRMAAFFQHFDALPIGHSHGNLWRGEGILMLYEITGKREYLDQVRAKWKAAVRGGYVWPLGGVGEHFARSFFADEGCAESDWLRLNLDLWRFTGDVRYLDMAERLLWNEYLPNQSANGGFGTSYFECDADWPTVIQAAFQEGRGCCTFHGPLGLYFLKAYVATGSDRGLFVNFPLDFTSVVKASGRDWQVTVKSQAGSCAWRSRRLRSRWRRAARRNRSPWRFRVRVPGWARHVEVADEAGRTIPFALQNGYLRIERSFLAGRKIAVTYSTGFALEGRRFEPIRPKPGEISRLRDVALLLGPDVLLTAPVGAPAVQLTPVAAPPRPVLLATIDAAGKIGVVGRNAAGWTTVALPRIEASEGEIRDALHSNRPVLLRTLPQLPAGVRASFMSDLVVVPNTFLK